VIKFFVASELGVVNLLQRHFDWSGNALWFQDIPHGRDPARTMFFVGGQDAIVRAEVRAARGVARRGRC
jgi:hypothetical protein